MLGYTWHVARLEALWSNGSSPRRPSFHGESAKVRRREEELCEKEREVKKRTFVMRKHRAWEYYRRVSVRRPEWIHLLGLYPFAGYVEDI